MLSEEKIKLYLYKTKKLLRMDTLVDNFLVISVVLLILQGTNIILGIKFFTPVFLLTFLLFIIEEFYIGIFSVYQTEKLQQKGNSMFSISIVLFLISIISDLFHSMAVQVHNSILSGLVYGLSFFIYPIVVFVFIYLQKNEKYKMFIILLKNNYLFGKIRDIVGLQIDKEQTIASKVSGIQICVDANGKPVVIPEKDRYLHMLILGPTGCGKTSQVIIPMVNQDMQNMDAGITVLEPKGDLAETVYSMAKYYGRKAMYFNPIAKNCPYFNPLYGDEDVVIENMVTTVNMLNQDTQQFFANMNEILLRNSLRVLKRLYNNKATLIQLARLMQNSGGYGRKIVVEFSKLQAPSEAIAKENEDICEWFLNDYFNEKNKTYNNCSGLRSLIAKITSNKYLRSVMNPPNGENDVDFDKHLKDGTVIVMTTAQNKLRDLGSFLGYFLILQFQAAVFRRKGHEEDRRPHFFYVDEFQKYANPGFTDMLTQGRSYRVASHLATQNRALIGMGSGKVGKDFIELVSTNARNLIIFPGANKEDAQYYEKDFGNVIKEVVRKGYSRQNPSIFNFSKGTSSSESVNISEEENARFSSSDITYQEFGKIIYRVILGNSIQFPGVGHVKWISKELKSKLDALTEEYNAKYVDEPEQQEHEEVAPEEQSKIPKNVDPISIVKGNVETVAPSIKLVGTTHNKQDMSIPDRETDLPRPEKIEQRKNAKTSPPNINSILDDGEIDDII